MSAARKIAPPPMLSRQTVWTAERIDKLTPPEVKQLRANAERLQEPEIAELCTKSLKGRPRPAPAVPAKPRKPKPVATPE